MQCGSCGQDNPDGARFCAGCGVPLAHAGTDPVHPLLGKVVGGRYRIVGLLGEGGMGVVYKAEQQLGSAVRKVAVKTLHAELSRDAAITARFHREVGTIAQLEHPNTVRVYDFGSTDDGTLYIAMEFLDGKSLSRVIQNDGALPPRRVEHLLQQIAGSLDEAHSQGIVHRDLKPDNVLLIERAGEKDVVKLVDFGIAARTEQAEPTKQQKLTQQGMVLGTPPYMSPEQFSGKALDARSDIYSLGVVIYEMLTGQLPFQADTPWQWATQHMTSPPRSFDELPTGGQLSEAVRRAVLRALAKTPEQRPKSVGDFYAEFSAALTAPATAAPPLASAKTEAMTEASSFAIAPTQAIAAANLARQASVASPVALPAAPAAARSSANRPLLYGLVGLGSVLLLAIGAVALRGAREPRTALEARTDTAAPASDAPGTGPEAEQSARAETAPASREPARPRRTVNKPNRAGRPLGSEAGTNSTSNSRAPTEAVPAKPDAPAPVQTAPSAVPEARAGRPSIPDAPSLLALPETSAFGSRTADPCTVCLQAAGNLRELNLAVSMYQRCTVPAAKAKCSGRVAALLPKRAEYAANNGRCQDAKAMREAALQMGVPESSLANVQAVCK